MNNVLDEFERVSKESLKDMIEESKYNHDLRIMMQLVDDSENKFKVDDFLIEVRDSEVFGIQKKRYSAYSESQSHIYYEDINLFQTIVYLIKKKSRQQQIFQSDPIIAADGRYGRFFDDYARLRYMLSQPKLQNRITLEARFDRCVDELLTLQIHIHRIVEQL